MAGVGRSVDRIAGFSVEHERSFDVNDPRIGPRTFSARPAPSLRRHCRPQPYSDIKFNNIKRFYHYVYENQKKMT